MFEPPSKNISYEPKFYLSNLNEDTKKLWKMSDQLSAENGAYIFRQNISKKTSYDDYNLIYQFYKLSKTLNLLLSIDANKTDLHEKIATLNDSFIKLKNYLKEIHGLLNDITNLIKRQITRYSMIFDFYKLETSEEINYESIDLKLDSIKKKYENFEKIFDTLKKFEFNENNNSNKNNFLNKVFNNIKNRVFTTNKNIKTIRQLITTISLYEYEDRFNYRGEYAKYYNESSLIVYSNEISSFFYNVLHHVYFKDIGIEEEDDKKTYINNVKKFCHHFIILCDIFDKLPLNISKLNKIIENIINNYNTIYFIKIDNETEIGVNPAIEIINKAFDKFKAFDNFDNNNASVPQPQENVIEDKEPVTLSSSGGKKKSRRKRTRRSQNRRRKCSRRYKNAK